MSNAKRSIAPVSAYTVVSESLNGKRTETKTKTLWQARDIAALREADRTAAVSILLPQRRPAVAFRVVRVGPGDVHKSYPTKGVFEARELADYVAHIVSAAHKTAQVSVEPLYGAGAAA